MVFLGSSGWKKKISNCSKWNRERPTCGFGFISGKTTEQSWGPSREQNPQPHRGRVQPRNPFLCRWAQTPLFTALSALMLDNEPCGRPALCCSWHLADTPPPLLCALCVPKAFSAVPVSLWHHVLRKSPACGNLPGGASASFYLQEYLGSKVFCLMEEAVCLPPRSSSVKFPSFGKRVQILGLEKESEGGEKNDKFQYFLSSDLDQNLVCYFVTSQVG